MMIKRFCLLCTVFLAGLPLAQADVTLSPLFSDQMVLQRDQENYLWGWADAGEAVLVTFDGHQRATTDAVCGRRIARCNLRPHYGVYINGDLYNNVTGMEVGRICLRR